VWNGFISLNLTIISLFRFQSKQQYVDAIKYLESNLNELKQKLNAQITINETLKTKKQGTEEQLQNIRMKFDGKRR
jgi:hypothetical protein